MSNLVKFKGCRRCSGDLFLERDSEGIYVTCLQCGAIYLRHINHEDPTREARRRKVLAR